MESSSDKQLRNKLTGTEFPFDPKAWEQMEAMLDEKKKRRGFFWWWAGGIAAALLLVVFGYELREITGEKNKPEVNAIATTTKENDKKQASSSYQEEAQDKTSKHSNAAMTATKITSEEKNSSTPLAGGSNSQENARGEMKMMEENNANKKLAAHKVKHEKKNIPATQIRSNPRHSSTPFTHVASTKNKDEYGTLLTTTERLQAANVLMNRSEASFLNSASANSEIDFNKKENEDLLPKKKKKHIFSYSLGVLANVTGTTLSTQKEGSLFYSKPSYMVGFTHDFLFVNRVAITNSILYSQTSFKVYSPKTISFSKAPTEYTCHITELAIPIGIKVYPVVKNNFRFYINAGIINHIKLKETFDYTMTVDTSVSNLLGLPNLADVNSTLPPQTDFTGNGYPYEKLNTTAGTSTTEQVNTNDFSINQAKRYYASFYASAGFEFIAKKHFVLFTEPMFYMSLQKIGVQEKRKYNVGLSGGFRYQF